jgi:DNA-binding transcriptional LysR family regulator
MPKKKKLPSRGAQWSVTNVPTAVRDWEAARVFLEVSRCGSFRAAALKLGQSVNTLRRTVEQFERDLGVSLLTRYVRGVQLTEEGARITEAAQRMENASFDLLQARNSAGGQVEGEVRISVTEGMGTYWLLPQLIRFQRANPGLVVNMRCGPKPADLLRLQADLSIQLQRPTEPDLKVLKLGSLHLMLWASQAYVREYGRPMNLADLKRHRFILLEDEMTQWEEEYRKTFPGLSPESMISFRINTTVTHSWAVAGGGGIGILPSYLAALGGDLVPLDLIKPIKLDIWLAYHPGAKRIPRVSKVMDWIIKSYDPRRMPWFRDEFIHPDQFAQLYRGRPMAGQLTIAPAGPF